MIGLLTQLLGPQFAQAQRDQDFYGAMPPPSPFRSLFQQYLERMDEPAPTIAPMRDPRQAGPAPPVSRPLSTVLGGRAPGAMPFHRESGGFQDAANSVGSNYPGMAPEQAALRLATLNGEPHNWEKYMAGGSR